MTQARRETLGPRDLWVLRDSRDSQDSQVLKVSAEDTVGQGAGYSGTGCRATPAEGLG